MTIKKKGMKGGHRVGTGASRRRFTHARSSYMTRMRRDELKSVYDYSFFLYDTLIMSVVKPKSFANTIILHK